MADYRNDETASWDAEQVRSTQARVHTKRRRPKRRRYPVLHVILYLLCVFVASAVLAGVGWLLANDLCAFNKAPVTATVEITSEDNLSSVANKLKDADLIEYKGFFKLFGKFSHAEKKIGIGTYELNTDMDYRALITSMHNSSGNMSSSTVKVTIPEGYTVAQAIQLLAKNNVSSVEALTEAAQKATFNYDFIHTNDNGATRLEGYLFPDTYEFYVDGKPSGALKRLLTNFDNKMSDDLMAKVELSGHSLKDIITVASLIEKETDGSDQATIASVIYNRLADKGAHGTYRKLQVDASLLYALPEHTGPITNADKKVDSPYNLYKHEGLPPTPIANPGLVAIKAAIEPESTDYYYYALGKDGKHRFFTNYNDHMKFLKSDNYAGN